jgi:hypothetical protein
MQSVQSYSHLGLPLPKEQLSSTAIDPTMQLLGLACSSSLSIASTISQPLVDVHSEPQITLSSWAGEPASLCGTSLLSV